MARQLEFKKIYNPGTGKFTRQHIWSGEGITDKVKSLFGKKTKKQVKFAPPPLPPKPTTSNKAGDNIVKMLSSKNQQDINNKVLSILSGGKII